MPARDPAVGGKLRVRELTDVAVDKARQKRQSIIGVGRVELVGGRKREFHVRIDPARPMLSVRA